MKKEISNIICLVFFSNSMKYNSDKYIINIQEEKTFTITSKASVCTVDPFELMHGGELYTDMENKVENCNGECVKETTLPKSRKQPNQRVLANLL